MTIYFSILGLAALMNLIGFLWLVVTGFKRSVLWGLLVFLFSPLTAVIFALTNWFDARKPFVVYIVSLLLMVGTGVYMYSEVGTENMQKLSSRLQSGEIRPDEAVRLIEKAILQAGPVDLFREEPETIAPESIDKAADVQTGVLAGATGSITEPAMEAEPAVPADAPSEVPVQAQVDTQQDDTPQETDTTAATAPPPPLPPAYPTPDRIVPDPLAVRKEPRPEDSLQISLDKAGSYVGRYLIVEMKNGSQQRGLLARVDGKRLVLNRKLYGGNMEYPLYTSQIKSIRVLKQGTEPKS